jgi:hypothetical protein
MKGVIDALKQNLKLLKKELEEQRNSFKELEGEVRNEQQALQIQLTNQPYGYPSSSK